MSTGEVLEWDQTWNSKAIAAQRGSADSLGTKDADMTYDHPYCPDEYGDCTECDGGKSWEHSPDAERGSADLFGILAGLLAAACLIALMAISTNPTPKVLPVSAYRAVPTTIATPQAPPVAPQGASIPPAVVTAPKIAPRLATATVGAPDVTTATTEPAPVVHLSCEVLADGQDTVVGNGTPGWYRQGIDSDVVALNPDHVRNCTPAVTP